MIHACYVVCNEADVIADSIRSVKAYVDRFVFIDSVFTANPMDATHSTDDTRGVCERMAYPVPIEYVESDRKLTQEAARNEYLDRVPKGDWVFNLDGDEVLYSDYTVTREVLSWLQFGKDGVKALAIPILSAGVLNNGFAIDVTPHDYETAAVVHSLGYAPRIFQNRPTLRYREYIAPNGIADNQGAWEGDRTLYSRAVKDGRLMLVNHHVRQSYEGYQADAIWEALNNLPSAEGAEQAARIALRVSEMVA